jgi:dTDP-4-amino-4,6-dideoxygalactose transaminase
MKKALIISNLFHAGPRIYGLKHFHLPKTELIFNEVLSLPMYLTLTKEKIDYIVGKFNNFFLER